MPAAGLNAFRCTVTFTPSEVEVTGVVAGEWHDPEGYTSEQPLTIVLSYADVDPQPDPTKPEIVRWSDDGIGTITTEILDGIVDEVAKTISVTVTGFSDYEIMENVGVGSMQQSKT